MDINNRWADLHIHSLYSDGTMSYEEILRVASEKGLCCISITDHDMLARLSEEKEGSRRGNLEIIPGIEFTAEKDNREVHLLAYYISYDHPALDSIIQHRCQLRRQRLVHMIERLRDKGVFLSPEEVMWEQGPKAFTRLHLAQAMYAKGYVSSLGEAFVKYIGDGKSCYVSGFDMSCEETIAMIRSLGGIPILAHPYLLKETEKYILTLKDAGLAGIEVFHPDHPSWVIQQYLSLAKKHDLLVTGGSDYHGGSKQDRCLGNIKLSYQYVERLREAKEIVLSS